MMVVKLYIYYGNCTVHILTINKCIERRERPTAFVFIVTGRRLIASGWQRGDVAFFFDALSFSIIAFCRLSFTLVSFCFI